MKEKEKMMEVAMISAVISDHFMKQAYDQKKIGYLAHLELIALCSLEFFKKHKDIKNWEALCESEGVLCWEEVIFKFAVKHFKEKHDIKLSLKFEEA